MMNIKPQLAVSCAFLLIAALTTSLAVAQASPSAASSTPSKARTMKGLLADGWRVSSHSLYQYWKDDKFQTRSDTWAFARPLGDVQISFVLEKPGASTFLCWGNERQGYNNPCRQLN